MSRRVNQIAQDMGVQWQTIVGIINEIRRPQNNPNLPEIKNHANTLVFGEEELVMAELYKRRLLAAHINDPKPLEMATTIITELDHFAAHFKPCDNDADVTLGESQLTQEPFIGYLETDSPDGSSRYLVCRNRIPEKLKPALHPHLQYTTKLSPIGDMLTAEPGQSRKIVENWVTLTAKAVFTPRYFAKRWDANGVEMKWKSHKVTDFSLRSLLHDWQTYPANS